MSDRSALSPLTEQDAALFETLTPELARALYPDQSAAPFTITAIYPQLEGDAARAARELEAAAVAHAIEEAPGKDAPPRHRTTFSLRQIEEFHELYHLAEQAIGVADIEVLLNGKAVPLTRELWLPLLWTLRA
ncbi:MAG: hypothetical protein PVJ49_07440 [Acidobacteriota bacterium]|jgi:hypothetical protein